MLDFIKYLFSLFFGFVFLIVAPFITLWALNQFGADIEYTLGTWFAAFWFLIIIISFGRSQNVKKES
jgi:hypothetical protein